MDNQENDLKIRNGFWKTQGKTANFTRPCLASLVNVRASPSLPAILVTVASSKFNES